MSIVKGNLSSYTISVDWPNVYTLSSQAICINTSVLYVISEVSTL